MLRPGCNDAFFKVFVFVSAKTKQNILLAVSVCFHPSTLIRFPEFENAYFLIRCRLSSALNARKRAFFRHRFQLLRFYLSTLKTECFQDYTFSLLLNPFSKASDFSSAFSLGLVRTLVENASKSMHFHEFGAFETGVWTSF